MILLWEFLPPSGLCGLTLWGMLNYSGGGGGSAGALLSTLV